MSKMSGDSVEYLRENSRVEYRVRPDPAPNGLDIDGYPFSIENLDLFGMGSAQTESGKFGPIWTEPILARFTF